MSLLEEKKKNKYRIRRAYCRAKTKEKETKEDDNRRWKRSQNY